MRRHPCGRPLLPVALSFDLLATTSCGDNCSRGHGCPAAYFFLEVTSATDGGVVADVEAVLSAAGTSARRRGRCGRYCVLHAKHGGPLAEIGDVGDGKAVGCAGQLGGQPVGRDAWHQLEPA
jgi:hypothetical protein